MSARWTCSGCGLRVSFATGFAPSFGSTPPGWSRAPDDSLTCKRCRREEIIVSAKDAGASRESIGRQLAAFEWRLAPDAETTAIARRVRVDALISASAVEQVREQLRAAGEIAAPPPPTIQRRERAIAELRRDPRRSNRQIVEGLGDLAPSFRTLSRIRGQLEQAGEIERWRGGQRARSKAAA